MKKPSHQWETRAHLAVRTKGEVSGFRDDPRAEAFTLHFHDGRRGEARLGLRKQVVDEVAASDPDLVHAVKAWLCARGERSIALYAGDRLLAQGAFAPSDLGDHGAASARLVTLCPSNAEMVHALGCFGRVIACEDSSDFPPEVAQLPRLGPDLAPDLDRVAALAPDLAISSLTVPGMERIVTGLRARGVAQRVLAPRCLDDVLDEAVALAAVLGVPARGEALRSQLENERDELLRTRPTRRARVYLEWWPKPMYTPGATCFSNELIALAGGLNVFGERAGSSVEVRAAELVNAAPEVCFVSWCGVSFDKLDPQNLVRREGLADLPAVRSGQVYALDEAFSGRPGPRMLEAARLMARAIRQLSSRDTQSLASDP